MEVLIRNLLIYLFNWIYLFNQQLVPGGCDQPWWHKDRSSASSSSKLVGEYYKHMSLMQVPGKDGLVLLGGVIKRKTNVVKTQLTFRNT